MQDEYGNEGAGEAEEFGSEELPPTDDVEVELDEDDLDPSDESEGVAGETATGDLGSSKQAEDMAESDQADA